MKKCFLGLCLFCCAAMAFAGPPGGGPPRHGGPGPHHGGHDRDGVGLAVGITGIVANSLGILNNLAAPRSYYVTPPAPTVVTPVYTQPVYTAPTVVTPVYTQPVCPAPVYTTPVYPAPVCRPAPPPPPPRHYAPPHRYGPPGRR